MAFRTQTATFLVLLITGGAATAQNLSFSARHDHLRKHGEGWLIFNDEGVSWREETKPKHSRTWPYAEIQRLELAPNHVRIVTYEDIGWQLGRDREYLFEHLPADVAERMHPLLTQRLDQRYLAHLVDPAVAATSEMPAKLLIGRKGSNGRLKFADGHIVFDGGQGESRTWKFADIQDVSRENPFELTVSTIEGDNRIQLKAPLPEDRFQDLWRALQSFQGLKFFGQSMVHEHVR